MSDLKKEFNKRITAYQYVFHYGAHIPTLVMDKWKPSTNSIQLNPISYTSNQYKLALGVQAINPGQIYTYGIQNAYNGYGHTYVIPNLVRRLHKKKTAMTRLLDCILRPLAASRSFFCRKGKG